MQKLIVAALAALMPIAVPQDAPKPTCNKCAATYISNDEIQDYFKRVGRSRARRTPPSTIR